MNYYNEIDPYCCEWLRNLMAAGLIPAGDVDDRDIRMVRPADLVGYAQCHFFAGIAGWSYALELAGWPEDEPVWTGSCPCQPFSAAGQRKGFADERHLWPAWFDLIRQCRPATVFGEQVDAGVRQGWLDAVFTDLESEGYACGAAVLPAAGVGAPHIRKRLWFVAHDTEPGRLTWGWTDETGKRQVEPGRLRIAYRIVADADEAGLSVERSGGLLDGQRTAQRDDADGCGASVLGNPHQPGSQGRNLDAREHAGQRSPWAAGELVWLPCTDGKARPTEPGLQPLAHGVPGRVGRLRAYGNAIVPQVAAAFIGAFLDVAP